MSQLLKFGCSAFLLLFTQLVVAAGVGINATRVIYPEKNQSVSIGVRNTSQDSVYLLQTRVLSDLKGGEQKIFHASPPIFRMEPDSLHKVRIKGDTATLPKDRESVFYFQATAIPGSKLMADHSSEGQLSAGMKISMTNTIKLFYRPAGLAMTPAEAGRALQVMLSSEGIKLKNTSPYYLSFAGITVNGKALSLKENQQEMLAPFSEASYSSNERSGDVRWKVINDLGGIESYQTTLR
ncbi:fimbrial biogenesis chaperone [Serratia liquefaciens]|uniref:fimbrial biogenesis chaperone n=1 Tax=Serratia liquefaciens TaxID=614 RepID=UPI00215825D9|nr:molecular chaperone [Serratia liquefaciens]